MGSRTFAIIALGLAAASPAFAQKGPAAPPAPPAPPVQDSAADLERQGVDLYKSGDYSGALDPLDRAYTLAPNNFAYRYSLAQALAHANQCDKAIPHLKALHAAAPDPETARDVRAVLEQCPGGQIVEPPPPPAPPPPPKVVVRSSGPSHMDRGLMVGSGAALGLGVGLLLAAHWSSSDSDVASRYSDHSDLDARSTRLYIAGGVFVAAGVALGVYTMHKWKSGNESTEVAAVPRGDGGAVVLSGKW